MDVVVGGVGGGDGDINVVYVGLLPRGGVSTSIVIGQIRGPKIGFRQVGESGLNGG